MKLLFLIAFSLATTAAFANNEDSACKSKLYNKALRDTSMEFNYYICFKLKLQSGKTIKTTTGNFQLWLLFKRNGYSFEEYCSYMTQIIKDNTVFDYPAKFGKDLFYFIDCSPQKGNQAVLKKGVEATKNYINKKGQSYFGMDAEIMGDIIYQFWEWGIGIRQGEEGNLMIGFNCAGLRGH